MYNVNENVIEFLKGDTVATVTFSQGRYVNHIKGLAKRYPDKVQIMAENKDGSIVAHVPVDWVKIRKPRAVSDEQKASLIKNLKYNREGV